MTRPTSIFEQSALEVLARLAGDKSPESRVLAQEAFELSAIFQAQKRDERVDAESVARLFSLYRRSMTYLIDRQNKFGHYLPPTKGRP